MASNYGFIDLDRLMLTKRQKEIFLILLPYLIEGNWVTSLSVYEKMRFKLDPNKDCKLSVYLKFCEQSHLLERKDSYLVAINDRWHFSGASCKWAYRIKPELISEKEIKVRYNINNFTEGPYQKLLKQFDNCHDKLQNHINNIQLSLFP